MKKIWVRRRKRRIIVERIIELSKADDLFDIEFWQESGVQARFSAAWKMIGELNRIRGMRGHKFRLQRSVQTIKQI